MFDYQAIWDRLKEKPFRPFRIVTTENEQFDIRDPELVRVGRQDVTIGFATPRHPTVYDTLSRVHLAMIAALEDLLPSPISRNSRQP